MNVGGGCGIITLSQRLRRFPALRAGEADASPLKNIVTSISFRKAKSNASRSRACGAVNLVIIISDNRLSAISPLSQLGGFAAPSENIETKSRCFAAYGFAVSKTSSLAFVIITSDNRLSAISPLSRLGGFAAPPENIVTSICFRKAKTNA